MNKKELVAQCLADNPVMTQTINNVERELSEQERKEAANAWADMRLAQIAHEAELAEQAALAKIETEAKETQRRAIANRLGLTTEELQVILG